MQALSGLDAGFLYIETPETLMHVGSLCLYELPEDLDDSFLHRVREHIRARVHLAPILSRRLALMPFQLGHPVWAEAEHIDFCYHVQGHVLSKPGRYSQLETLVAHLHAQPLDRDRPLWEFHVIEGLADGRVALYSKVHHAALDGAAGVALAQALLDLSPTPREVPEPGAGKRTRAPSRLRLLGSLLGNSLAQYAKLARSLPGAVKSVASGAREQLSAVDPNALGASLAKLGDKAKRWIAPRTNFNRQIGAERDFATLSLPFRDIKAVAGALDATINDLVLALCAGALRHYLASHHRLPKATLVAAVPISLREGAEQSAGNQVTMLPCPLGTDKKSVASRLQAIQDGMEQLKQLTRGYKDYIPTDFPSLGAPWLIGGLASLAARARIAERVPLPVNLVISNVPGPPVPLYLAGARMLHYYPASIVTHGLGLNITVHSYAGSLDFGVMVCKRSVPDLKHLMDGFAPAFDELRELAAARLAPKRRRAGTKAAEASKVEAKTPAAKPKAKPKRAAPRRRTSATEA